mgnify:CR=1 FL=1
MNGSSKNYIEPDVFVDHMREHWTGTLENVSSSALEEAWGRLAQAFEDNITSHNNQYKKTKWIVVQPPTGSGKTQGTILYSALLAQVEEHPGVLIVTRLIAEADSIAEQVNQLAGKEVAVAHHSESKTSFEELSSWPVLVITHRAYELALDYLGQDGTIQKTFDFFHNFESFDGKRKMVVVDECLDIIETSQVKSRHILQVLYAIDMLPSKFPKEYEILKRMKAQRDRQEVGREINPAAFKRDRMVTADEKNFDFSGLRAAVRKKDIKWDQVFMNQCDIQTRRNTQNTVDETLKSLEHMSKQFMYYAKHNREYTWNTARALVPEDVKGAVVLDATAGTNHVYKLFGHVERDDKTEGVRNYQNVTLHVAVGHTVGKEAMVKEAKERCQGLLADLETRLSKDTKALVVTHKDVEPVLKTFSPGFEMKTGHWGAVNGVNTWKDCDTIVIFGMPYKPNVLTMTTWQAAQEQPMNPDVADLETKTRMDQDRSELKQGWLKTDIIQAFNRIRCRKVIDSQGNCPEAEGYIMFKSQAEADEVLKTIREEMPGIKVVFDWELTSGKKKVKKSNAENALISFFGAMEPGKRSKSDVQKFLGISARKMDGLMAKAKDPESTVGQAIAEAGVQLDAKGPGKPTYFTKR